jgi:hypothetical protein
VPPIGVVGIDPFRMVQLPPFAIPPNAALVGIAVHAQALLDHVHGPRLTNPVAMEFVR